MAEKFGFPATDMRHDARSRRATDKTLANKPTPANRQETNLNEQQQQSDGQSDDQGPVDANQPDPAENPEPRTSQQADQNFREAVDQQVTDDPQNAGEDDSRTSQPALEEDEDSLAKPKNS